MLGFLSAACAGTTAQNSAAEAVNAVSPCLKYLLFIGSIGLDWFDREKAGIQKHRNDAG
jgi:hypothetical protein